VSRCSVGAGLPWPSHLMAEKCRHNSDTLTSGERIDSKRVSGVIISELLTVVVVQIRTKGDVKCSILVEKPWKCPRCSCQGRSQGDPKLQQVLK
jgi:hypothetical protein